MPGAASGAGPDAGSGADRADDLIETQRRLRALLAVNRSIIGELSLSPVLQRIVEAARGTVGARYAALRVLGPDGRPEALVHSGMDDDVVAGIATFPSAWVCWVPWSGRADPCGCPGSRRTPGRWGSLPATRR